MPASIELSNGISANLHAASDTDAETNTPEALPEFNATKHGYMLERSYAAASRLNLQHYLWKETLGFSIHPNVAAAVPPSHQSQEPQGHRTVQVADVGCGTGSWLIDAARERPDWEFTACDINLSQLPPTSWHPKNLRALRQLNALEKIPDDLKGAFDVVHVRLFLLVVENADPRPMLRNLIQMVRPGGWLQWEEVDPNDQEVIYADGGAKPTTLSSTDQLITLIRSAGRHAWIPTLAGTMQDLGLVNTQHVRFCDPPHTLQANSDQHMLTMEEFATRLRHLNKSEQASQTEQLIEDAVAELRSAGAAYNVPKVLSLGQRL